MFRIITT